MQVVRDDLSNLERKLTITVEALEITSKVEAKLRKIAAKVKMPGFRPGKVPFDVVQRNYRSSAHTEVLENIIKDTYTAALQQEKLSLVGLPKIDIISSKLGEPLVYTAILEIYPEVKLNNFKEINVKKSVAQVTDADVDEMLEKMRKANVTWQEIVDDKYKSKVGDQLTIDFTIQTLSDNKTDEPKLEKDVKLVLGDGSMWGDFEKELYGVKVGEEKKFTLVMPATHIEKDFAGKSAVFVVKIHKICQPILPDLNDDFACKMHIKNGGLVKLREEIRSRMERELKTVLRSLFKEAIMDKLLEHNPIEVPKVLVEYELKRRADEWHKRFADSKNKVEKTHEFPRADFEPHAKRSVSLELLLLAVTKEHQIEVETQEISKRVDELMSSAYYEDKEEIVNELLSNQQYLTQIKSILLEKKVVDYLASQVNVTEKSISYKDAMAKK
ncbi:MAG: trigger factor [Coxiellaceae bacterium]|jgi:trigger factor|nr:trigger factor [Coxiellaceae bacterium]